jgi:hypothetical protein
VETQLSFAMFKPSQLQVPISRLGSIEGAREQIGARNGTFTKGSKNPIT